MAVRKSAGTSSKCGPARDNGGPSRFVYRGNAVGAAGRITRVDKVRGLDHVLPVQAASSLPTTGGVSESVLDRPYWLKITSPRPLELFYIGGAHTLAEGHHDLEQKAWRTFVRSHVHDVHLLGGRIAVESIVAELSKVHLPGKAFPEITPSSNCTIRGLSLDGRPVEVELNIERFCAAPTMAALRSHMSKNKNLRRAIGWVEGRPPSKGIGECNIIASVRFPQDKPRGVVHDSRVPNRICWKGVGTIYLGELVVSAFSRRLTMLRVSLGSAVEGDFMAGEVEDDGHTLP